MAHNFGSGAPEGAPQGIVGRDPSVHPLPPPGAGRAITVSAQVPRPQGRQENRLPHAPKPAFYYKVNPLRWQWVHLEGWEKGKWLPLLGKLKLIPGCNGVDKRGDTSHAEVDGAKRGWTVLPWNVLGERDEDIYIRAYPCIRGLYYCSRWEVPQYIADRPLPSRVDREGFFGFLQELMARGIVRPPDPFLLSTLVDAQRQRLNTLIRDIGRPGVDPLIEAEQLRLDNMVAATAEVAKAYPEGAQVEQGTGAFVPATRATVDVNAAGDGLAE